MFTTNKKNIASVNKYVHIHQNRTQSNKMKFFTDQFYSEIKHRGLLNTFLLHCNHSVLVQTVHHSHRKKEASVITCSSSLPKKNNESLQSLPVVYERRKLALS